MKSRANTASVQREQGYEIYRLKSDKVEVAVAPELGAKIISLRDLQTGREWLWHPAAGFHLFSNKPGTDFSQSPLIGIDECLPTIAPCLWQGTQLADHGEVWSASWQVDEALWKAGHLKTSVVLNSLPFVFERTLELHGNQIVMHYRLENRSATQQQYLWAMHPLLRLQPGDRLQVPPSTRELLKHMPWIDGVDSAVPAGGCAKAFARPVEEGFAGIANETTGDGITFRWDAALNNTLGVWLTRGGWNGHHHFALEPTNGDDDALTEAAKEHHCGVVPGFGAAVWKVVMNIGL